MQTIKPIKKLLSGWILLILLLGWSFLSFFLLSPVGKIRDWALKNAVPLQTIKCEIAKELYIAENNIQSIAANKKGDSYILGNSFAQGGCGISSTITQLNNLGQAKNLLNIKSYNNCSLKQISNTFLDTNIVDSKRASLIQKYFKEDFKIKEIKVSHDNNSLYILGFSYGFCPQEINTNQDLKVKCDQQLSQRVIIYKLDLKSLKLTEVLNKVANHVRTEIDRQTGKITTIKVHDLNYDKYYSINNKGELFLFEYDEKQEFKTKNNDYRLKKIGFKLFKNFDYYGNIPHINYYHNESPFELIGEDNNFYFQDYIFEYNSFKMRSIDLKGYYEDFSGNKHYLKNWSGKYLDNQDIFYKTHENTILILDRNNGVKASNQLNINGQISDLKLAGEGIFYAKIIPLNIKLEQAQSNKIQIIRCQL